MLLFLLFCFSFLEPNNSHFQAGIAVSDTSEIIVTDSIFLQKEQHLPFDFSTVSDSFLISYADSLYFKGNYKASYEAFDFLIRRSDNDSIKAYSYYSLGDLWDRKLSEIEGNRDSAITYYREAIKIIEDKSIDEYYFVYDTYSLISEIYRDKRLLDSAEYYLRKVNIDKAEAFVQPYWIIEYYTFMTSIYYYRREYTEALKWEKRGSDFLKEKELGAKYAGAISLLLYRGAIEYYLGDYFTAEQTFLKVLNLAGPTDDLNYKMAANRFLGHIWKTQGEYHKGLEFHLEYVRLHQSTDLISQEEAVQLNEVLSAIGYEYRMLGKLDSALSYRVLALEHVELIQENGVRIFEKAENLYKLSRLLYTIDSSDVEKPFGYLDECDSLLDNYMITQFSDRVDILSFHSKQIRANIYADIGDYRLAADYYWQAYTHLRAFLSYISNPEDKLRNYQDNQESYYTIIDNLFKAHEETGDVQYVNKGLEVVETMRSLLLYQKTFEAGEETTISFLDTGYVAPEEFLAHKKVQREFHEYQEKHTDEERLTAFHEYLRGADKTFLSYFLSGNQLHIVLVDGEQTVYKRVVLTVSDIASIKKLKDGLYETNRLVFKFGYLQELELLYKLFITPIESYIENNELVVSKSGLLSYIPFDILISDISELKYLIEDYSIQNVYSWHHMMLQEERKKVYPQEDLSESEVLAFAPFAIKSLVPAYAASKGERFLAHSLAEVNAVSSKAIIGREASKQLFLEQYESYPLIHLATHAASNTENVMKSHIAFFPSDSNMVAHRLYFDEIAQLDFSKQALVILSACETSYGENIPIEGIMSLERAFAYAQAPSLVSSQWKADDESTAFIVAKFYDYLRAGYSKSTALQNAKIDFLHEYPRCRFQPLFWGGIILTGDDTGLIDNQYMLLFKMCVYALLLTFIGLLLFYTIRKKSLKL